MTGRDVQDVYLIGGSAPGPAPSAETVGGKAANLARLDRLGLAVPPALAIPIAVARAYMDAGCLPPHFPARLRAAMRELEMATGLTLGGRRPLVVSVRSSPPASMPGMLQTVLNVGLNEQAVRGLIRRTGNPWLAWDAYRRFVRGFAEIVHGAPAAPFNRLAEEHLARSGVTDLQDLDPLALRALARAAAALVPAITGERLPADPFDQILQAIEAVLRSWNLPCAREYRRLNGLGDATGTGVLVQVMVFGNGGHRSGSGVGFTRNPATGARELYVDFVVNRQGEDVVGGRLPLDAPLELSAALPDVWDGLQAARVTLEREFGDMQDVEFVVDEGRLYFLQTRAGKRTPWAAVRIAADLVREGLIDPAAALARLAPYDLDAVTRVVVQPDASVLPLARATPASMGVAIGAIVFDARRACELAAERAVVLARPELTTDDLAGLAEAGGVVSTFGGRTSHAAVVARQLGKVCLVGCTDLRVDDAARSCAIGGTRLREGDTVTLDGETGRIYRGAVRVVVERPDDDLRLIESWRGTGDPPPGTRQPTGAALPIP